MLHFCPTLQSVVSDIEVDWMVFLTRGSTIGCLETPDDQTPLRKGDRGRNDLRSEVSRERKRGGVSDRLHDSPGNDLRGLRGGYKQLGLAVDGKKIAPNET